MPNMNDTMERVASRAVEMSVYLPLGAYARVRDEIVDLNRASVRKLYEDLVDRGHNRMQPIERVVKRRAEAAEDEARDAVVQTRKTAKKAARKGSTAATQVAPKMPRVGAPRKASELPIKSYASLNADEIVSHLKGLTQTDLARVYKYEKAHEERSTILDAIDSRLVALPIATYDSLTVDEVIGRLDGLSPQELRALRRYESETKMRTTIIEKIESLLG
ncbi:MAG: hypothetical protein ACR2LG_00930 [Actinomycetota bacterium]